MNNISWLFEKSQATCITLLHFSTFFFDVDELAIKLLHGMIEISIHKLNEIMNTK